MQNKLHFAATGHTAAELIAERADPERPNMGLTTWKGAMVRRGDVTIAKNYLQEEEIEELNRIVVMFLDFAEDQARRRRQDFLRDWERRLDDFLRFNERPVLPDSGRMRREEADAKALERRKRGPGEDDARASCRLRRVDQRAGAASFVVIQITPARPAAPALASPSSPLSSWIVAIRSGSITLYPSGSSD